MSDRLLVLDKNADALSVLNPETLESRALLGETPIRVVSSPDGKHVLVSNRESDDVSVIDPESWTEIDRYDTGLHPDGIAPLPK